MLKWIAVVFLSVTACSPQKQSEASSSEQSSKQTPEQIAQLGSRSWAAFECAALAGYVGNGAESERLFNVGHTAGLAFIKAAQAADQAHQERIMRKVPMIVSWHLGGPSPDFMLGRVWEAALQFADDEINERSTWDHQTENAKAEPVDKEVRKMRAENKFREGNCALIK